MLREQILGFAIKTIMRAVETKEKLKSHPTFGNVTNYVRTAKMTAKGLMDYQWQKLRERGYSGASITGHAKKKQRKSSIKPAKEIGSTKADIVLARLRVDGTRLVTKTESINGKTSLAYLVWALGHAERAQVAEGISVHDVSALLYRACNIELYPINISRVVYGNQDLVKQSGQQKRTKTYLLTDEGMALFEKNFG